MARGFTTSDVAKMYQRQGLSVPDSIKEACGAGDRSKYNVGYDEASKLKRTVDAILFDSEREAFHYKVLKIALDAGTITDLELQPRFLLQLAFLDGEGKKQRKIEYVADFKFTAMSGVVHIVDVKGHLTEPFRIKWKMALARYPQYKWEIWK